MSKLIYAMLGTLFLALTLPAAAQPGPGYGQGQRGNCGMGMGPCGQGGGRGVAFANNTVPGWSLMTSEERTAHRDRILSAKSYEDCKAIQQEQHEAMLERAKAQGKALPMGRMNVCDRLRTRGAFQ